MKYIDAEKLITEIKRLRQEIINKWSEDTHSSIDDGFLTACSRFLDVITSLQQEQPNDNIDKIINDYFKDWKFDDELDIMIKPNNYSASFTDLKDIAKYFFELGLNARKEKCSSIIDDAAYNYRRNLQGYSNPDEVEKSFKAGALWMLNPLKQE